jgi:hypothetical protein
VLAETRQALAEALEGQGYLVFDYVVDNPVVPCVVLVPGEPYLEATTIGKRFEITFEATLMVSYIDNQASLINLENLIETFLDVLPQGVAYGSFSRPGRVQVGPSEALASKCTIQITATKE